VTQGSGSSRTRDPADVGLFQRLSLRTDLCNSEYKNWSEQPFVERCVRTNRWCGDPVAGSTLSRRSRTNWHRCAKPWRELVPTCHGRGARCHGCDSFCQHPCPKVVARPCQTLARLPADWSGALAHPLGVPSVRIAGLPPRWQSLPPHQTLDRPPVGESGGK
jgi:hypothetical protein